MYLQLLTAMELIENRSSYDSDMDIHAHECLDYNRDMTIADYTSLVTDATHVGSWSEMMQWCKCTHSVLQLDLRSSHSHIPPTSASTVEFHTYTFKVIGRGIHSPASPKFSLTWSSEQSLGHRIKAQTTALCGSLNVKVSDDNVTQDKV